MSSFGDSPRTSQSWQYITYHSSHLACKTQIHPLTRIDWNFLCSKLWGLLLQLNQQQILPKSKFFGQTAFYLWVRGSDLSYFCGSQFSHVLNKIKWAPCRVHCQALLYKCCAKQTFAHIHIHQSCKYFFCKNKYLWILAKHLENICIIFYRNIQES